MTFDTSPAILPGMCRWTCFLLAAVGCLLPSHSEAMIRQSGSDSLDIGLAVSQSAQALPAASSYAAGFSGQNCRNDPVDNIDPMGLVGKAAGREMGLPDGNWKYLYSENWYEPAAGLAVLNAVPLAFNLLDAGVGTAKAAIDDVMGPGSGDAAEAFLVANPAALAKVPQVLEQVGGAAAELGGVALNRAGRSVSAAVEWWHARRPSGSTAGSIGIGPSSGVGADAAEIGRAAKAELHRPYIRKAVRAEVDARAPRTADGRPIDPNTMQPIEGRPDLGHKSGHEFRAEKTRAEAEGLSQKQFNDRMNDADLYQLENPTANRSRRYEAKQ